jgi:hypothetical protein
MSWSSTYQTSRPRRKSGRRSGRRVGDYGRLGWNSDDALVVLGVDEDGCFLSLLCIYRWRSLRQRCVRQRCRDGGSFGSWTNSLISCMSKKEVSMGCTQVIGRVLDKNKISGMSVLTGVWRRRRRSQHTRYGCSDDVTNSKNMTQDYVLEVWDGEGSSRVKEIKPEVYLHDVLVRWTPMTSGPSARKWCNTMSRR